MDIRQIVIDEMTRRKLTAYAVAKLAGLPIRGVQMFLNESGKERQGHIRSDRLGKILDVLEIELRPKRRGSK